MDFASADLVVILEDHNLPPFCGCVLNVLCSFRLLLIFAWVVSEEYRVLVVLIGMLWNIKYPLS